MTTEEEGRNGRNAAIAKYRILAFVDGGLGVGLLICGVLAVSYETDTFGPPYFVGCFIVGVMAVIQALLCGCIFMKGPEIESDFVKKRQVACAITGQYTLAMFTFMGCFIGLIFVGISGNLSGSSNRSRFYDEDEHAKENKILAIITFVCCFLMFFLNIFTLYMVCTYGSFFGVIVQRGRRGRTVVINTSMQGDVGTPNIFASTVGAASNNIQIQQLQTQNMLLQQQLDLQRQLAQQQQQLQQQQPTQFSGGMYPPPPPPSYSDTAYPPTAPFPSAPPPSYDKVAP